jgi:hypothetical protein
LFWNCGPKPQAWFCSPDGYYEYSAIIPVTVYPNQPTYHVGNTVTLQFYWPTHFVDSVSNVNFSFNDQLAANPFSRIYYLDDDSLYPGNGIDSNFDLLSIIGNSSEAFFGGYPEYYVDFLDVDSGMLLEYKIIFNTPGRFMHTIQMYSDDETRGIHLGNCRGEIVNFYFFVNGPDYYSSISATPRPFDLQSFYNDYHVFENRAGFIFNVQP